MKDELYEDDFDVEELYEDDFDYQTDEELLAEFAAHRHEQIGQDAFTELTIRYTDKMMRFAARRCDANTAEEVVQSAWIQAARDAGEFNGQTFDRWIRRQLVQAIGRYNVNGRRLVSDLSSVADYREPPADTRIRILEQIGA